jgi:site-specific DNA recombinase
VTTAAAPRTVRVAAYCRKSHAQGLEQEFNSIDAQRQSIESFVASQRGVGWVLLDTEYSDGGYSGANTDRPGFQRLLGDVAAGKVDCIAVYRLDRLSRSIMDYLALLRLFEKHGVTFVSVTEQFNTTTPVGRLVLNQLILFSQFEREVISERVRDKVQATRRRGAWTGGRPILGYDVVDKRLAVNADEAAQVRATFQLYLEHGTLRATVEELRRRGWRNKTFRTRKGTTTAGSDFAINSLHGLLVNPLYIGQVRAGDDLVAGVHEAIVPHDLWAAVQERLRANANDNGVKTRNATGALLRGILRCGRCGSAMVHSFSTRGSQRHRYYVCTKLHTEGADACPGSRVPAGKFETFVADQIRVIGTDEALLAKTAETIESRAAEQQDQVDAELRRGERERQRLLAAPQNPEAQDQLRTLDARLAEVRAERQALDHATEPKLRAALSAFTPVWEHLFPAERERVLRLLIEQITYDPDTGEADIDLRPAGITTLAKEAATR